MMRHVLATALSVALTATSLAPTAVAATQPKDEKAQLLKKKKAAEVKKATAAEKETARRRKACRCAEENQISKTGFTERGKRKAPCRPQGLQGLHAMPVWHQESARHHQCATRAVCLIGISGFVWPQIAPER